MCVRRNPRPPRACGWNPRSPLARRGSLRRARGGGALFLAVLVFFACGKDGPTPEQTAQATIEAAEKARASVTTGPHDVAVLDMGKLGEIRIELLPELAPKTVAQFEKIAREGVYDGTYFHRVIPGFMIQGGDPNTKNLDPRDDGRGSYTDRIPDEFSGYPTLRGTVAMANDGYRDSSSCQFFIVQQDIRQLDGQYSVFGRVISGMDVVDAVTKLKIDKYGRYGPPDRPYPVNATLDSVRIEPAADTPKQAVAAAAPGQG